MKRPFVFAFFLSALLCLWPVLIAEAKPVGRPKAFIVMDAHTGTILNGHNINQRLHPASMTKMMTLYHTFELIKAGKLKWADTMRVSRNAANKEPARLGLRPGETISVRQAVLGIITKSANDAATALGEKIGGSEAGFSKLMNRKAAQLGMLNTTFHNPSGLSHNKQKSTALDMAKLAQALYLQFGDYYALFSTKSFKHRGNSYQNTNKLLGKFQGLDGVKTGYTRAAGFNLAASARQGHHRLITVAMGYDSQKLRDEKIIALMTQGFKQLRVHAPPRLVLKRKPQGLRLSPLQLAHRQQHKRAPNQLPL